MFAAPITPDPSVVSSGTSRLASLTSDAVRQWTDAQPWLASAVFLALLFVLAWLAYQITRRYVLTAITRVMQKTNATWDEDLEQMGIFRRLAWAVPFVVIRAGLPYIPALAPGLVSFIQKAMTIAIVIVLARATAALLEAVGHVYARSPNAAHRPIKGYLQAVTLVVYIAAAIILIAALIDRDPLLILGSLGAASAVLLLVFRDTILSLVAGVQLTGNDLIRVGDWIEMPDFNADGDVIDISLNTVTVQNWDKTLTIIPAHKFLDNSFKNWRGMQASGGRRIKRSLHLDVSTVRFLTKNEIGDLRRFALLRPYFDEKSRDIGAWLEHNPAGREQAVNARRLTNVGTFRAYIDLYLRSRPDIATGMTFLVRQLQPTDTGLPLELYVFVNDVRWSVYEGVQADIFDHLLAIAPEFGLRVFQQPSGHDLRQLIAPASANSDVMPGVQT